METRYLLIIAKDTSVRRIVMETCTDRSSDYEVVFGSGFGGDRNFSQVIKNCIPHPTSLFLYSNMDFPMIWMHISIIKISHNNELTKSTRSYVLKT